MSTSVAFIPGAPAQDPAILGRFLPPTPGRVAPHWLARTVSAGAWVLDPFGASPQMALEAAAAGYRILVAANNPITRFLLEINANPPDSQQFQAVLADLAASKKGDERLEPHLRTLYRTECANCGLMVEAQAFIWEREGQAPVGKIYDCPYCDDSGEHPANSADAERAAQFSAKSLHHARALERVAPLNDPDRVHVEKALQVYPGRAVYALFTLVNKLDSFPEEQRRHLTALLLVVCDQGNALWPHPPTFSRPRRLRLPSRYLEKNIWLALEDASQTWSEKLDQPTPIPLTVWPEAPPEGGGVCLYQGRLKELSDQIQAQEGLAPHFEDVLSTLPRPNQAFWALSALWAGWLWGAEASAHFKSVLRRWRYDWGWHSVALQSVFQNLKDLLEPDIPVLGVISELEPGFLSSAVLAAQLADFKLEGIALRPEQSRAQITWLSARMHNKEHTAPRLNRSAVENLARQSAQAYLAQRGQPADYHHLLGSVLCALCQQNVLQTDNETSPANLLQETEESLQRAFSLPDSFLRYSGSSSSLEIGHWWLDPQSVRHLRQPISPPLADRLEIEVVRYLQRNPGCGALEMDQAMCAAFNGLFTPTSSLVTACLHSYGDPIPPDSDRWQLRAQDDPQKRREDIREMVELLEIIGRNLGFQVRRTDPSHPPIHQKTRQAIIWENENGLNYRFYVLASTVFGGIVFQGDGTILYQIEGESDRPKRSIIILPGGRAGLVERKLALDPRLRAAIETDWQLVKFRHLRRLASESHLKIPDLDTFLALDPIADRDPQLKLL